MKFESNTTTTIPSIAIYEKKEIAMQAE